MMPEPVIRSRHNPVYKELRSLLRRERRYQERAFLVEGPRFIEDAGRFGFAPRLLAIAESFAATSQSTTGPSIAIRILDDDLFGTLSDTTTSQGMIGLFAFPEISVRSDSPPLLLIADGIQDPGNLGTLIRSAAAAGASQVITLPGTVDPWAPKTVRAAAAAHFVIPIERCSFESLPTAIPMDAAILGADAAGAVSYDRLDLTGPIALFVGGEGHGLSAHAWAMIDHLVTIPLQNGVESLNAGVAGSIVLFEANRQRSLAGSSGKTPAIS